MEGLLLIQGMPYIVDVARVAKDMKAKGLEVTKSSLVRHAFTLAAIQLPQITTIEGAVETLESLDIQLSVGKRKPKSVMKALRRETAEFDRGLVEKFLTERKLI